MRNLVYSSLVEISNVSRFDCSLASAMTDSYPDDKNMLAHEYSPLQSIVILSISRMLVCRQEVVK